MSIGQGMPRMRRAATALGFGILLVACQAQGTASPDAASVSASRAPSAAEPAASSQPMPAASPAPKPMTYRELAGIVGVECKDPDKGEKCFTAPDDPHAGDYWDVELLPDCGEHGFFGGVVEPSGASVVDKVPPEDTVRRATLSKGQIVCIQAIARAGQQPMYLYVVALPAASIAACKDNPLCEMYGDREVTWHAPHGDANCRMVANGRFEGACAAGWIYDKELEGFSEGI